LAETTFDNILRTRVQAARPTIITTNCSPAELARGYGSAVLSLLIEQSVPVEVTGEDFRHDAQQRNLAEADKGWRRAIV
jgi:hypothetical protein